MSFVFVDTLPCHVPNKGDLTNAIQLLQIN